MQQCDASLLFSFIAENNALYLCLRIARWKGLMASRCGKSRSSLSLVRILQADLSPRQPFFKHRVPSVYKSYRKHACHQIHTYSKHREKSDPQKSISDLKFSIARVLYFVVSWYLRKMADAVTVFAAIETVLTITQVGSHYFLFTVLNAFYNSLWILLICASSAAFHSSRKMSCVMYTFTQKESLYCRWYNLASKN